MVEDFYRGRLRAKFGINVVIPDDEDRAIVHDVIYKELCRGTIRETSRQEYIRIIQRLAERGAQAVILGCTEVSLLVGQQDTDIPLFDTTRIHAISAVEFALS